MTRTMNTEEDGNDIDIVETYKECSRCGFERTVSENKQVRAGQTGDSTPERSEDPSTDPEQEYESAEDDAIILSADSPTKASPDQEDENELDDEDEDVQSTNGDEGVHIITSTQEESATDSSEVDESGDMVEDGRGTVVKDSLDDAEILQSNVSESGVDEDTEEQTETTTGGVEILNTTPEGDSTSDSWASTKSDIETKDRGEDNSQHLVCPGCEYEEPISTSVRNDGDACPECLTEFLSVQ